MRHVADEEMVAIDAQSHAPSSHLAHYLVPPATSTPASIASSTSKRVYLSSAHRVRFLLDAVCVYDTTYTHRHGPLQATRITPIHTPAEETSSDEREEEEEEEGEEEEMPRMTSRQRALNTGEVFEELVELPARGRWHAHVISYRAHCDIICMST